MISAAGRGAASPFCRLERFFELWALLVPVRSIEKFWPTFCFHEGEHCLGIPDAAADRQYVPALAFENAGHRSC